MSMSESISEREATFWSRAATTGCTDDCWPWTGARACEGYGQFHDSGKNLYSHRLAYEYTVGPIPEGLQIDHLCRNRACVNPWHLEAVTQRVNKRRGTSPAGINAQKTHCKHGHEFTPENTYPRKDRPGNRECRACIDRRWREQARK